MSRRIALRVPFYPSISWNVAAGRSFSECYVRSTARFDWEMPCD